MNGMVMIVYYICQTLGGNQTVERRCKLVERGFLESTISYTKDYNEKNTDRCPAWVPYMEVYELKKSSITK